MLTPLRTAAKVRALLHRLHDDIAGECIWWDNPPATVPNGATPQHRMDLDCASP